MCKELYEFMSSRHNIEPKTLDNMLSNSNHDYSMTPLPVLLQPSILLSAIEKMQQYNGMKGTDYGFNIGSILSLVQIKKKKRGDTKYKPEFQLEKNNEGIEYLKNIFRMIEDSDDNNNEDTIMKMIETTQRKYGMEPTTVDDPKLFLVFLPMGQSIDTLQKTLMSFIKKHKLWKNYYVYYSNSNSESENGEKEFMKKVEKSMELTKQQKKKGCILLLGHQGKLGITYPECDVTIHLDNGTNIDDAKQTYYRSLTERKDKKIGINVDLNIQRVYMYVKDHIREYRKDHNDRSSTDSEILQIMFTENQFIFNPSEFGFDGCTTKMIEYFDKYGEKLRQEISIDSITENIECNDDLHELIKKVHLSNGSVIVNQELNGNQPDCPKGKKTKEQVDSIESSGNTSNAGDNEEETPDPEETNDIIQVNRTKKLYEFLTKLSCLLLRINKVNPINKGKSNTDLLIHLKNKKEYVLIQKKLIDDFDILEKDLNIIFDRYIDTMALENNQDVLDDIFDIYARSNPKELRNIIEKHFIPTQEQRKKNAEIPTPVACVDEMIDTLPCGYFKQKNKTFEPCCGKGNFVLAIFEKLFDGLSDISDEVERCRIIIEECLYFADLDPVNVYITKELLMCHAIYKLGEDTWSDWGKVLQICNFNYKCKVGNTLELDINKEWGINGFDAIIGNPPYEKYKETGDNKLYLEFFKKSIEMINDHKYILYITPINIKNYLTVLDKNREYVIDMYKVLYMAINTPNKHFKNVGNFFTYFLLQKEIVAESEIKFKYLRGGVEEETITIFKKGMLLPLCSTYSDIDILKKTTNIYESIHENYDVHKSLYDNGKNKMTQQRIRKQHLTNGQISNTYTTDYKYKIIDKIGKRNPYPGIYYYNKTKMKDYGLPKTILCTGGDLSPSYDSAGIYNISDNMLYILTKSQEEFNIIKLLIYSKLFNYLCKVTMTDNMHGRDYILKVIKKISITNIYNDTDIYNYFGLTESEIKLIERTV